MKNMLLYPVIEILIISCFIAFTACTPNKMREFECTIMYIVDDQQVYEDTISMSMPDNYVPTYATKDGEIVVDWYPNFKAYHQVQVYKGNHDVKVLDFRYKEKRTFYTSVWDGREVKMPE